MFCKIIDGVNRIGIGIDKGNIIYYLDVDDKARNKKVYSLLGSDIKNYSIDKRSLTRIEQLKYREYIIELRNLL